MLEVICGGMFAGKSELLIHRLKRASYAKKNIVAFKPAIDDRYSVTDIASHSGQTFKSIAVKDSSDAIKYLKNSQISFDVVGFDEAQFFDEDIVKLVDELSNIKEVYVAGLDLDSAGKPFGSMPHLLAIADKVTKVSAVCMKCGSDATRSQRLVSSSEQVMVGASGTYEARCRKCWKP
jgi:thymidine kinase